MFVLLKFKLIEYNKNAFEINNKSRIILMCEIKFENAFTFNFDFPNTFQND